jgi:hypothetical protein
MSIRSLMPRVAIIAALAVLAFVALNFTADAPAAEAAPVSVDCTFTPPIEDLIAAGGGPGNVTCDFSIRGEDHTISVDYTVDFSARPPVSIDSCTLDSEPLHAGPCP